MSASKDENIALEPHDTLRSALGAETRGGVRRERATKTRGRRTTLRIPHELDRAATAVADEVGTTTNEALVLLARLGARELTDRREKLRRSRKLLASFEAEHGAIPDEVLAEVDRLWPV